MKAFIAEISRSGDGNVLQELILVICLTIFPTPGKWFFV